MESNKTAVEWLIFHWMELDKKYYGGEIGRIDYRNRRDSIQAEAKEMFEQQIIDAWFDGTSNWDNTDDYDSKYYYEKTFNK
jgi:hypothetical protein